MSPVFAEFRILGPLEVTVGSRQLELGGTRQQVVLAMLLLSANSPVSADRLEEAIYGQDPPPTSRSQALITVSLLRRLLADHGCPAAIARQPQGYVLRAGDGHIDAARFADLITIARAARDAGQTEQAVAHYRDALRQWRGPALDGVDSLLVQVGAARLDEQRITVIEERLALELDLGRHHELIGELAGLTEQFALRERLREQLMLALYRSGRAAEALQVYQQTRRMMIEELGIEPGAQLQRLQHAVLAADPVLDSPVRPSTGLSPHRAPQLLPADIADFTDRPDDLTQIRDRLTASDAKIAVPVLVITGQGGVGKTSLAVHASHLLAGEFQDGQLFADLHGGAARPVRPAQVLERFLLALGVPGPQIPGGLDARAEAYRGLLAGRRVLVVLDDAATESQVVPLLPGTGEAAVLITSRSPLAGIAGASRIVLDVFDAAQSLDLLGRIAGNDRVAAQAESAAVVAGQCGHLPLALRIAGARLAVRPHWGIQQMADRLADQARRLDELTLGETGVRASIGLSYRAASEPARRLLRRLALVEAPAFGGWVSAALLDQPPAAADDALDDLLRAQLIETSGTGHGLMTRYRFHELVRLFARERMAVEEPASEQQAALERVLGALLHLAEAAAARLNSIGTLSLHGSARRWPLPPQLTGQLVRDPTAWFERERGTLVAGVRQAAAAGLTELCWSLAMSAEAGFETRTYLSDWLHICEVALEATRQAGNVRGQAATLYSSGCLHQEVGRLDVARRDLDAAAQLFRQAGDDAGFAHAIRGIAGIDRINGRLDLAADKLGQALAILRRTGDEMAVAHALYFLSRVKLESDEPDAAHELLAEALRLTETTAPGRVKAQVLYVSGQARLQAGDAAGALNAFALTLAIVRELGDQIGTAHVLTGIGAAALRQGDLGGARSAFARALEVADTVGVPTVASRAQVGLSQLAIASGNPAQAVVLARQAADSIRHLDAPADEARALAVLADAYANLADTAAAEKTLAQATALRARAPAIAQPYNSDG
jgi:DNA-binding SARP family transcriptional activator